MSDETKRGGKNNLYPDGNAQAGKQVFQVWDQETRLDGCWTDEIVVPDFTPLAMETAFFVCFRQGCVTKFF